MEANRDGSTGQQNGFVVFFPQNGETAPNRAATRHMSVMEDVAEPSTLTKFPPWLGLVLFWSYDESLHGPSASHCLIFMLSLLDSAERSVMTRQPGLHFSSSNSIMEHIIFSCTFVIMRWVALATWAASFMLLHVVVSWHTSERSELTAEVKWKAQQLKLESNKAESEWRFVENGEAKICLLFALLPDFLHSDLPYTVESFLRS